MSEQGSPQLKPRKLANQRAVSTVNMGGADQKEDVAGSIASVLRGGKEGGRGNMLTGVRDAIFQSQSFIAYYGRAPSPSGVGDASQSGGLPGRQTSSSPSTLEGSTSAQSLVVTDPGSPAHGMGVRSRLPPSQAHRRPQVAPASPKSPRSPGRSAFDSTPEHDDAGLAGDMAELIGNAIPPGMVESIRQRGADSDTDTDTDTDSNGDSCNGQGAALCLAIPVVAPPPDESAVAAAALGAACVAATVHRRRAQIKSSLRLTRGLPSARSVHFADMGMATPRTGDESWADGDDGSTFEEEDELEMDSDLVMSLQIQELQHVLSIVATFLSAICGTLVLSDSIGHVQREIGDNLLYTVSVLTGLQCLLVVLYHAADLRRQQAKDPLLRAERIWTGNASTRAMLAELGLVMLHCPPGLASMFKEARLLNYFVFLRLPSLERLLQDKLFTYEAGSLLAGNLGRNPTTTGFLVRTMLFRHGAATVSALFVFCAVVFTLVLGVSEVGETTSSNTSLGPQDEWDVVWLQMMTITAVGFGDFEPVTVTGQVFSMMSALSGIVITTLSVALLSRGLDLSKKEKQMTLFVHHCEHSIETKYITFRVLKEAHNIIIARKRVREWWERKFGQRYVAGDGDAIFGAGSAGAAQHGDPDDPDVQRREQLRSTALANPNLRQEFHAQEAAIERLGLLLDHTLRAARVHRRNTVKADVLELLISDSLMVLKQDTMLQRLVIPRVQVDDYLAAEDGEDPPAETGSDQQNGAVGEGAATTQQSRAEPARHMTPKQLTLLTPKGPAPPILAATASSPVLSPSFDVGRMVSSNTVPQEDSVLQQVTTPEMSLSRSGNTSLLSQQPLLSPSQLRSGPVKATATDEIPGAAFSFSGLAPRDEEEDLDPAAELGLFTPASMSGSVSIGPKLRGTKRFPGGAPQSPGRSQRGLRDALAGSAQKLSFSASSSGAAGDLAARVENAAATAEAMRKRADRIALDVAELGRLVRLRAARRRACRSGARLSTQAAA
eukprot:TRINITY_DN7974_c0_g1_i3.p1 TRINITY_DN7974_c0_g1~~TRINITY_DN7974_c0_g1_i3.p1  ORF type:complete len:1052 (+),score=306.77 TRINITY_DN7974_c0_g1_i3:139-3156(+)